MSLLPSLVQAPLLFVGYDARPCGLESMVLDVFQCFHVCLGGAGNTTWYVLERLLSLEFHCELLQRELYHCYLALCNVSFGSKRSVLSVRLYAGPSSLHFV
jgi:hypothetical protein